MCAVRVPHTPAERARVCHPPTQTQTACTEGKRKRQGIWGRGRSRADVSALPWRQPVLLFRERQGVRKRRERRERRRGSGGDPSAGGQAGPCAPRSLRAVTATPRCPAAAPAALTLAAGEWGRRDGGGVQTAGCRRLVQEGDGAVTPEHEEVEGGRAGWSESPRMQPAYSGSCAGLGARGALCARRPTQGDGAPQPGLPSTSAAISGLPMRNAAPGSGQSLCLI